VAPAELLPSMAQAGNSSLLKARTLRGELWLENNYSTSRFTVCEVDSSGSRFIPIATHVLRQP